MKFLKLITSLQLLLIVVTTNSGFAQSNDLSLSEEQFCQMFLNPDGSGKRPTFKETMTLFRNLSIQAFNPEKMVEVQKIETTSSGKISSGGEKVIFTLLPNPTLTEEEEARAAETLQLWQQVKKLKLVRKMQLKLKLDLNACIEYTKSRPEDFALVQKFHESEKNNAPILSKKMDARTYSDIDHLFKKYTRDGWTIVKSTNYAEILKSLYNNRNITEVMFYLHSITDGTATSEAKRNTGLLYDASSNIIPAGFFSALPNSLQKVILMTCHAPEVIEHYKIKSSSQNYDLYFAVPAKRFAEQLHGSLPNIARYAFLDAARADVSIHTKSRKDCRLEINSSKKVHVESILFSRNFIGVMNGEKTSISFDCSLIHLNSIRISISYLGSPGVPRSSLQISSAKIILADGIVIPLNVKETFDSLSTDDLYEAVAKP
jgi:hypothetical protein